jgi:hypothetical protein
MSSKTRSRLLALYFGALSVGAAAGAAWLGYAISGLIA